MSSFTKKWSNRTAELRLPRPRTIPLAGLDSGPTVDALFASYTDAVAKLANVSLHQVARWEAVGAYSTNLGQYAQVLATHASTADPIFLTDAAEKPNRELRALIERLVADEATRGQGLAGALHYPTLMAAVAVALTAFAVNDNSRDSFTTAQTALAHIEQYFVDFERIERSVS